MEKKELISDLIWSFNCGVDETVSENPKNWFSVSENYDFANRVKNQNHQKNKKIMINNGEDIEKIFFEQKNIQDLEGKFSKFLKGKLNEDENFFFGKGFLSSKVVLIFDCYHTNFKDKSENNILKRKQLFENIVFAIQKTYKLSNDDFLYLSFFPTPLKNVNIGNENYIKICDSFFVKYLEFIKSEKIIFVGNFVFNRLKEIKGKDLSHFLDKEIFVIPSLDLMLRAPERKKMAWETLKDII